MQVTQSQQQPISIKRHRLHTKLASVETPPHLYLASFTVTSASRFGCKDGCHVLRRGGNAQDWNSNLQKHAFAAAAATSNFGHLNVSERTFDDHVSDHFALRLCKVRGHTGGRIDVQSALADDCA